MTIKLLTLLCGPGGTLHPGVHSLEAARERELVKAGHAEFVGVATAAKQRAKMESARARPGETTALSPVESQARPPAEESTGEDSAVEGAVEGAAGEQVGQGASSSGQE